MRVREREICLCISFTFIYSFTNRFLYKKYIYATSYYDTLAQTKPIEHERNNLINLICHITESDTLDSIIYKPLRNWLIWLLVTPQFQELVNVDDTCIISNIEVMFYDSFRHLKRILSSISIIMIATLVYKLI